MNIFDNAKNVEINGKTVKSIKSSDGEMTLYINGGIVTPQRITLTNTGESSVHYGEYITVKAVYDSIDGIISNTTVTLYAGMTQLSTGTTNNNGEVNFQLSTLTIGTHQLYAKIGDIESNKITVTITRIPTSITINGQNSAYVGDSVTVSGTLSTGAGQQVRIFDNSTLITTVTTTANGAYTATIPNITQGTHSITAIFQQTSTHTECNASISVYVTKKSPTLTINVPAIIYSDAFNITGRLTDGNTPIPNATIKLYRNNNILEATATTNNNGEVTFTRNAPTTITTYNFNLTYEGNTTYNNTTSATVQKTVSKETSIINLNSYNNKLYTDGIVTLTGSLTDNDGDSIGEGQVVARVDGDVISSGVISDGGFSVVVDARDLSVGSNSVTVGFLGGSNYSDCDVVAVLTVIDRRVPDSIVVSGDKSVLSYEDNESCLVSALVKDGMGNVMGGVPVSFVIGGSVVSVVYTDVEGVAEYIYSSRGVGDVVITVNCSLVSETYSLTDATYYNNGSSVNGLSIQNGVSCVSDGEYINISASTSGEKYVRFPVNVAGEDNFELSWKFKVTDSIGQSVAFLLLNEDSYTPFNDVFFAFNKSPSEFYGRMDGRNTVRIPVSPHDDSIIRIQRLNEEWNIYLDDTLINNTPYTWTGSKSMGIYTNKDRLQKLKDIIIKPL